MGKVPEAVGAQRQAAPGEENSDDMDVGLAWGPRFTKLVCACATGQYAGSKQASFKIVNWEYRCEFAGM